MISAIPTIVKAAELLRTGNLTARALVDGCLARIESFESRVQAWVLVDAEGARKQADALDAAARRGEFAGPLHGIPLGIKDIVDVAGWPTRCGSVLRGTHPATADAEVVRRLRQAGAILIGKTVTTEFASFDPPPTANPWKLDRTPGGSSSGSAAATALGQCLAAIGSQTGGSIVRPAAYCGVCGFKPSRDAIPLSGIEPLAWHLDHPGPLSRSVADARLLFRILAEPHFAAEEDATDSVRPSEWKLVRIDGFFRERTDAAAWAAYEKAVEQLQAAGVEVVAADPPVDFAEWLRQHKRIMSVEAAAHHRRPFADTPELFGLRIRDLLQAGIHTSAVDYAEALQAQAASREQLAPLFTGGQLVVLPATPSPAPPRDTTGDPAFHSLWSFAGVPEITIPCSLSPDGLPCGLQLIGPWGSDARVLDAAERCEAILDFRAVPELTADS